MLTRFMLYPALKASCCAERRGICTLFYRCRSLYVGFRVYNLGDEAQGLGYGALGSGFKAYMGYTKSGVPRVGYKLWSSGFRVIRTSRAKCSGVGVKESGCRARGPAKNNIIRVG